MGCTTREGILVWLRQLFYAIPSTSACCSSSAMQSASVFAVPRSADGTVPYFFAGFLLGSPGWQARPAVIDLIPAGAGPTIGPTKAKAGTDETVYFCARASAGDLPDAAAQLRGAAVGLHRRCAGKPDAGQLVGADTSKNNRLASKAPNRPHHAAEPLRTCAVSPDTERGRTAPVGRVLQPDREASGDPKQCRWSAKGYDIRRFTKDYLHHGRL